MSGPEGSPIEIRNTSDNYNKYIVCPDITLMVSEETEYINYSTNHDSSGVTATTASKDQTIFNKSSSTSSTKMETQSNSNESLKRKSSTSARSNKKRNSSSKAPTEDVGDTSHDILNDSMAGSNNTHSVFTAHKERLVYHSQFFRSMFLSERPMSEATANCIPVILPRGTLIAFPPVLK